MISQYWILFGAIIYLWGASQYILAVIKGQAKPRAVTWCIWAIAAFIAFAAELGQGIGLLAITTFIVGLGPILVVIAGMIKGSFWDLNRFDILCGGMALLALIFWLITRVGNIAIIFSLLAEGMASLPTIIAAYKRPHQESPFVYICSAFVGAITLLTLKAWNLATMGFPLYLVVFSTIIFLGVIGWPFGRMRKRQGLSLEKEFLKVKEPI